jgi:DNA-binding CsgD family transcriptional regulator
MASTVQEITDLTVDVLDHMDGSVLPAEAVFSILCPRLDAPGAVLQRTTWRSGETDIQAHGFSSSEVLALIAATHAMRFVHPLMVANARGDVEPATAQSAAGGWLSWGRSPAKAFLRDLRGWDQMISLPLRGGPTEVLAFAFSRAARDFDERDLDLMAAVQPLLTALDRHARLIGRWRQDDDRRAGAASSSAREADLTGRELSVLLCLAEGLTAGAIAHRLGCSPRTVSKHSGNIYRKLEVCDRLSAVLDAQRRGILHGATLTRPASDEEPPPVAGR